MNKKDWYVLISDDDGHDYVINEKDIDKFYKQVQDVSDDGCAEFDFNDNRVNNIRFRDWEER